MPEKKKLKLNELKVKSFVTMEKDEAGKIKGGSVSICKTCGSECIATCGCTATVCSDCCPGTDTCNTNCGTCYYTECGTCLTCPPCNWTIERTCGPECSAITCY